MKRCHALCVENQPRGASAARMDLFTKPRSVRDLFLSVAARISDGIERSTTAMRPDVLLAFQQLTDAPTLWAFSLLLSGWQLRDQSQVAQLLVTLNLAPLYGQLSAVAMLSQFTQRAYQATSAVDLAGASAYFAAALENLGVPVLRMALQSALFRQAREDLLRRYPLAEARAATPPRESESVPIPQARAKRFDQGDYRARAKSVAGRLVPVQMTAAKPAPAAVTPLPEMEPPPASDKHTTALEWLADIGYSAVQIEAIFKRRIRFT